MTLDAVRDILTYHLGSAAETITPASRIREDLGADSLDFVEIIMDFEEALNIDIPDAEAEAIITVQDMLDYAGN